jgi:hypothetical protein
MNKCCLTDRWLRRIHVRYVRRYYYDGCLISTNEIETTVTELSKRLTETLKVETISQAEWARRNGVSTKSVSMLLNHSKRKAEGKECISKNELRNLAEHLKLIN